MKCLNENKVNMKNAGYPAMILPVIFIAVCLLIPPGTAMAVQKKQWTVETHDKTNFPLQGKHRTTPCSDCHLDGVLAGTPTQCESCHWYRKQDDRYRLQLGIHCDYCHKPADWKILKPNSWTHIQTADFRLEGVHKTLDCFQCHKGSVLSGQPGDCFDCHVQDYQRVSEPNHAAAQFPTDCKVCHRSMVTWEGAAYNHSVYPLKGSHQTSLCADCHKTGVYSGLPSLCSDCHMDDYNRAEDPGHNSAGYTTDCLVCHNDNAVTWEGAVFDHTAFILRGNHQATACNECHKNGQYAGTPQECVDCHRENYNNTTDPNHQQSGYSFDCEDCHGSAAVTWTGATVDHSTFPLKGNHKATACTDCHKNQQYSGTPKDCGDCHRAEYNNTTNPNHQQSGYSFDCEDCHGSGAVTWTGATVDHSSFPLKGNHKSTACTDCHKNGQYAGTAKDCVDCHRTNYNNTTDPNHQQSGYSFDCEDCHGSGAVTWTGASVDHSAFPLNGNHKTAACTDCHTNGQYAGTPKECSSCHQDDYNTTTNPNHQQSGYSTDCESCHGSGAVTWTGAVVDHSDFPLKGNHKTAACTDCHTNGQYAGTPPECASCHQDDYNNVTNPNHQQAGFAMDCVPCHGSEAVTWSGAVFNHDQYWPLQGAHKGQDCSKCHSNGYQISNDCYSCHKPDYDNASDPNHKSAGFPTSCDSCHFSNHVSWDQAVFNHQFPITSGDHANFSCNECHLTANYVEFSCIDCHEHNKNDMDDDHSDVSGYAYNSQSCYSCHPNGKED
ncbi:MAG: hypothetical protein GY940_19495 [bacterium]|nr:hypothetical protein [bacterium]